MYKKNAVIIVLIMFAISLNNRLMAKSSHFSSNTNKFSSGLTSKKESSEIKKKELSKLLKLLSKLESKAEDPLFKMHFKSLRTMIEVIVIIQQPNG